MQLRPPALALTLTVSLLSACDRGLVTPDGTDPTLTPVRDLVIKDLYDGTSLQLSWTNPDDDGFQAVRVVRREGEAPTSATDPAAVAHEVTGDTFADRELTVGTTYVYALYAVYEGGRFSRPATGRGTPTDPPELTPLESFVATPSVDGGVGLSWILPADDRAVVGVRVIRKEGAAPEGPDDGSVVYEGSETLYQDDDVEHGRVYGYAAFTFDDAGAFSTPLTATVATHTGPITGLVATSEDAGQPTGQVTLTWTNPSDPGYLGTRVRAGGIVVCEGEGLTSCVDESPELNTTNRYLVAAYDASGREGAPASIEVFVQDPVTLASAVLLGDVRGERALALDVAADGNAILAGMFELDAAFGEGAPTLTAQGATDGFVAKLSPAGAHVWSRRLGGSYGDVNDANMEGWHGQHERVLSIAPLADGSILVAGVLRTGATLDGLPGYTFTGSYDPFVARYGADGSVSFARRLGGSPRDVHVALDALDDGSFVVGGALSVYYGTNVLGAGEANETTLPVDGEDDAYFARYAANGDLLFARRVQTYGSHDEVRDVALLADGSIVITGAVAEAAVFGEGEPNETTIVGGVNTNFFVAKYAADGSLEWARGGVARYSSGLEVEPLADGSVLVTGGYNEDFTLEGGAAADVTLPEGPWPYDGSFVAKYSAGGDLVFAVSDDRAARLDVAADGSFVTGSGDGIVRWSPAGDVVWSKPIESEDYPWLVGIRLLDDGSVIAAGDLSGQATFGVGDPAETTLISTGSSRDIFLIRIADGRP